MPACDVSRHPIVFLRPRLAFPYSWAGHIPFAYLLMDLLRPRRFVELGTDSGNSYLAFCQAASALNLDINCTAVDSWQGDAHARRYGEDVYRTLKAYHDPRYASFSKLCRGYFDDAVEGFADASIDLLHIDGLHTYEAVRHDFDTWLPKLSQRAVVIFHDTQVRERGFEVWRLFEELKIRYPAIEFHHSNGLGVIQTGPEAPAAFRDFLELFEQQPDATRKYFEAIASTIVDADGGPCTGVAAATPDIVARLYYRQPNQGFDDDRVVLCPLSQVKEVMEARFELPEGVRPAFIRIDPADFPGAYTFKRISAILKSGTTEGEPIKGLRRRVRAISGDLLSGRDSDPLRLVTLESDPHLEFEVAELFAGAASNDRIIVLADIAFDAVLNEPREWVVARAQAEAVADLKVSLAQKAGASASTTLPGPPADAELGPGPLVAMQVAGLVLLSERGPRVYYRRVGEAFSRDFSVTGKLVGLENAATLSFELPGGPVDFLRFDLPALAGCYRMGPVVIDGHKVENLSRRVMAVHGYRLPDPDSASEICLAEWHDAPWFEFDARGLLGEGAKASPVTVRVGVRKEHDAIAIDRQLDAAIDESSRQMKELGDAIRGTVAETAASLSRARQSTENRLQQKIAETGARVDRLSTDTAHSLAEVAAKIDSVASESTSRLGSHVREVSAVQTEMFRQEVAALRQSLDAMRGQVDFLLHYEINRSIVHRALRGVKRWVWK